MIDYSEQFDKERRYRVEVSRFKYGSARDNFGGGRVDALATAERCIEAFKKDHNTEHLVDAANYLMFRYMFPLPGDYFKATDSSGSVGTVGTPIEMETEW
jgi:histidinol dehydrogenase